MSPEEYVAYQDFINAEVEALREKGRAAYERVDGSMPENLRPATAADITIGKIIYYEHGDDGPFWREVWEVLHPGDNWKAYTADDGCRYGLEGAFVRVNDARAQGVLVPDDYVVSTSFSIAVSPARAWFVVYDEQPSKGDPYKSDGSNTVLVGKHPVLWAKDNPNKKGITWLRFFTEIPLDVALEWTNYEDFRGSSDD